MRLDEHQVQIGKVKLSCVRRCESDNLVCFGDQPEASDSLISRGLRPEESQSFRTIDDGLFNGLDPASSSGLGLQARNVSQRGWDGSAVVGTYDGYIRTPRDVAAPEQPH